MQTIMQSDLQLKGCKSKYNGKVREVYHLEDDTLVMVASDRLSAFDVVMPKGYSIQRTDFKPNSCPYA
jgi:phosphoribosylaminoimidazole-succinocarboxamide synthase